MSRINTFSQTGPLGMPKGHIHADTLKTLSSRVDLKPSLMRGLYFKVKVSLCRSLKAKSVRRALTGAVRAQRGCAALIRNPSTFGVE
jgi:hypothetical protein